MKITELLLLDGYVRRTHAANNLSQIDGVEIIWNYRTGIKGYRYNCVCSRSNAAEISIDDFRFQTIQLDDNCVDHPSVKKIIHEQKKMWGTRL
jgi:hypothetical protein